MIETIFVFLAMAFIADEDVSVITPNLDERTRREREIKERIIREVFRNNMNVKVLWEKAWEAAFISLERQFTVDSDRYTEWLERYFWHKIENAEPLIRTIADIGTKSQRTQLPFMNFKEMFDSLAREGWSESDRAKIEAALVEHDRMVEMGISTKEAFPIPLPPGMAWDYDLTLDNGNLSYEPKIVWDKGFDAVVCNPEDNESNVLTFIWISNSRFAVWQIEKGAIENAIEEAAQAALERGWLGLFVDDEDIDDSEEVIQEYWETESGILNQEDIRMDKMSLSSPFKNGFKRVIPDPEDEQAAIWVAYQMRSMQQIEALSSETNPNLSVVSVKVVSRSGSGITQRPMVILIRSEDLGRLEGYVEYMRKATPDDMRAYQERRVYEVIRLVEDVDYDVNRKRR